MIHEDIRTLIPQRAPMLMVDALLDVGLEGGRTCLTIRHGNYFLDEDGRMEEAGILEHIAQSASAVAGRHAVAAGAASPPVGYIGEIRKFKCHRLPREGETLHTTITLGPEAAGITLLTGETRIVEETVAETQMKIHLTTE